MHPGQSPCNGGFRVVSDLVLVGSCFSQHDLFLGLLFGNKEMYLVLKGHMVFWGLATTTCVVGEIKLMFFDGKMPFFTECRSIHHDRSSSLD